MSKSRRRSEEAARGFVSEAPTPVVFVGSRIPERVYRIFLARVGDPTGSKAAVALRRVSVADEAARDLCAGLHGGDLAVAARVRGRLRRARLLAAVAVVAGVRPSKAYQSILPGVGQATSDLATRKVDRAVRQIAASAAQRTGITSVTVGTVLRKILVDAPVREGDTVRLVDWRLGGSHAPPIHGTLVVAGDGLAVSGAPTFDYGKGRAVSTVYPLVQVGRGAASYWKVEAMRGDASRWHCEHALSPLFGGAAELPLVCDVLVPGESDERVRTSWLPPSWVEEILSVSGWRAQATAYLRVIQESFTDGDLVKHERRTIGAAWRRAEDGGGELRFGRGRTSAQGA